MILYISDLDGTLLDSRASVSRTSEALINAAVAAGAGFTAATARTPLSALPILRGLNITHPVIFMNGALLYDPAEQRFFYSVGFPEGSIASIALAEAKTGMEGMLFSMEEGRLHISLGKVAGKLWDHYFDLSKVAHIGAICTGLHRRSAKDLKDKQVLFALYMDDKPELLGQMKELLSADKGLILDFYQDKYTENRWCLEISGALASKGTAVELLRRQYRPERIIAFGDSWNDVPLFDACDAGYAVANAGEELKCRAAGVIGSNLENGVAEFIHAQTTRKEHSHGADRI